jgi:glycosyltransferase involved in cell wall biosynthesis
VWNCPSREDAFERRVESSQTILHYHGNIGPELVPATVIKALALVPGIQLRLIGYSTLGQENFPAMLRVEAQRYGVSDRVHIQPALPRAALLAEARRASIGLALMPMVSSNENFRDMVGASNKPFDYLACGVPLLVSDLPEWRATFVDSRFGLACDPRDPMSIATALRWYVEHKSEGQSMGELGRQRILAEWNYETCFGQAIGKDLFDTGECESAW